MSNINSSLRFYNTSLIKVLRKIQQTFTGLIIKFLRFCTFARNKNLTNYCNIIEVKKIVIKFLKENIKCYDVTVIKIEKELESWNSVAELYEDDSFLKSMNLPPKKVRLFYLVKMDDNLEITSFERLNSFDGMDSSDQ